MKKVLVVDDESDARDFVRALLEPDGWEVSEAVDAQSGMDQVKALKPNLIILDVQMPEKDGFSLFADLVKEPSAAQSKIIMLTGVAEKTGIKFSGKDMGQFLGKEPDAYVDKPIEPEAFKRVVERVMSGT